MSCPPAWRRRGAGLVIVSLVTFALLWATSGALAGGQTTSRCAKGKTKIHGKCVAVPSRCAKGKTKIHGKCVAVPKAAVRPKGAPPQNTRTPGDLPGYGAGPGDRENGAVEWADAQKGSSAWYYRCEKFVENAYATEGQFYSAWAAATQIGLHPGTVTDAPRGSLMFFGPDQATNQGYGHVGISLGGGRMVS